MRMRLILLASCATAPMGACDEKPATPEAVESATSDEAAQPKEAEPAAAADDAEETTSGFVEAKVDGELKRFEYLPADDNKATTRLTLMRGQPSADSEEFLELKLIGFDVRRVELPMVFRSGMAEAVRGRLAAAQRMPALRYGDAAGDTFVHVFNDESLECQSLEDLVLRCTFSAKATSRDTDRAVEITDGRLEVKLTQNLQADAFLERTVGHAADEAVQGVQDDIDRRRGKKN